MIGLGLALQENDVDRFFDLLLPSVGWFKLFGNFNYANATEVFLLQWMAWKRESHPIVEHLRLHFKATVEEYGESAIHLLMTHIREWDYSGDNMQARWKESATATWCFRYFHVPRSHRETGTKWYSEQSPGPLVQSMVDSFAACAAEIHNDEFETFVLGVGYDDQSPTTDDDSAYVEFLDKVELRDTVASNHCLKIFKKISVPLKEDGMDGLDSNLFF